MSLKGNPVLGRAVDACVRVIRRARHFLLSPFLLLLFPLTAQAVFTTPGSFDVGPDGSAGYTVPIQVPPGTAGMAPKLSLSYNSNGGNGVLGMGWTLEGLSQIGRCPKTMAIDGVRGGINLDSNDRYCLDGQRLISTGGTYGADGTEYRTELANFAKIISYGTAGTGPAWFKVWTKGGQVIEYGNTADSRIEAQGKTSVLSWGVNKISDTKGNYLTVSYTEDNANGETLINRIDYTGNATATPALTPYASVQFTYETRPDPTTAYLAGSVIKTTKRMTNIKIYAGAMLVKDYRVAYGQSVATKRSRIKTFAECDGQTASLCLPSEIFSWSDSDGTNVFNSSWTYSTTLPGAVDGYAHYLVDVNGNGLADLIQVARGTNAGWISINPGNGNFQGWTYSGIVTGAANTYNHYFEDVNGDGLADLIQVARGTSAGWISINPGNGNFQGWTYSGVVTGAANTYNHYFEDVNGDGLADLIQVARGTNAGWVSINPGNGNFQGWTYSTTLPGAANGYDHYFFDANGDGLIDLFQVAHGTNAGWVSINPGNGNFQGWTYSTTLPGAANGYAHYFVDVNGDGLTDLVQAARGTNAGWVSINPGNGNLQGWTYSTTLPGAANGYDHHFMDINGDGLTDLVQVAHGTNAGWISINPGNGNFQGWTYTTELPGAANGYAHYFVDVNGDGLTDLFQAARGTNAGWIGWDAKRVIPDLLASVTHGLGPVTTINYKPLTMSIYTKDSGINAATYPVQDIQSPMYVVSSVSTSDGLGSSIVTNYTYGGAKADLNGRGFLGFRWTKAVSPDTNIALTTYYRQDYPYIGLPSQSEKRTTSGVLLSAVANTYANTVLTSGSAVSQFPYVSETQEQNYELDGSLVTSTTAGYQYDPYGNATQVTVNSNDGFVKTTANLYANDVPNWLLGRLLRSSVTTAAP